MSKNSKIQKGSSKFVLGRKKTDVSHLDAGQSNKSYVNRTQSELTKKLNIAVIGVGGGGSNSVIRVHKKLKGGGFDFLIINTDKQIIDAVNIEGISKLLIGEKLTEGNGSGANPKIGFESALESEDVIREYLRGRKLVFISVGLGGGTGSGAAPVIAKIAKEEGALVLSFGTFPWTFEGRERIKTAISANNSLTKYSDTTIIINNENFFQNDKLLKSDLTISELFDLVDFELVKIIVSITDLIYDESVINIDFNDIKKALKNAKYGYFDSFLIDFRDYNQENERTGIDWKSISQEERDLKITEAVERFKNPILVNTTLKTAKYAIINISAPELLIKMNVVKRLLDEIIASTNKEINMIFGVSINENLLGKIRTSVILTGVDKPKFLQDFESVEDINFENQYGIKDF